MDISVLCKIRLWLPKSITQIRDLHQRSYCKQQSSGEVQPNLQKMSCQHSYDCMNGSSCHIECLPPFAISLHQGVRMRMRFTDFTSHCVPNTLRSQRLCFTCGGDKGRMKG